MTVKELRKELKKYPKNQRVIISRGKGYTDIDVVFDIKVVEKKKFIKNRCAYYMSDAKCNNPGGDPFYAVAIFCWGPRELNNYDN